MARNVRVELPQSLQDPRVPQDWKNKRIVSDFNKAVDDLGIMAAYKASQRFEKPSDKRRRLRAEKQRRLKQFAAMARGEK